MRTQNLGSLLMKLSQSNFNLQSPDYYWVRSYLITTVPPIQDWKIWIFYEKYSIFSSVLADSVHNLIV